MKSKNEIIRVEDEIITDGVGESGVKLRRSLRKARVS